MVDDSRLDDRLKVGGIDFKEAVEALFNVNVTGVNTILVKGKTKFFRGTPGKRLDVKKAIVTLKDGQCIDVTTGL
jgi:large subunit ribosomal protein L23